MLKKNRLLWSFIVVLYLAGLLLGCLYQVKIKEQAEMYEYLKSGVSGYGESLYGSIRAGLSDNVPEFLILVICAFLPFGAYIVCGIVAVRGFMTGFALTCALRTYSLPGFILCIGNILSAVLTIPCFVFYGLCIFGNHEDISKTKLLFFTILYLGAVLFFDGVIKGGISPLAIKFLR